MSDSNLARRTEAQVVFNGVDITVYVNSDLISLTYTDNEEDEADDLQIKVLDRERNWLQKWLDTLVSNAAIGGNFGESNASSGGTSSGSSGSSGTSGGSGDITYKVTATTGVNVRTNTTSKGKILGKLPYGTIVTVNKFSDGWAQIRYTGKTAWIKGDNLKMVGGSGGSGNTKKQSSGTSEKGGYNSDRNSDWAVGAKVIVTGRPQYSSYGEGKPGTPVTNWNGKITLLNLKEGIPYPIHVDYLGWFAENQVQLVDGQDKQPVEKTASKGLKISAAIVRRNWNADGTDEVLDCGQFELDSVKVDGPPNTVTIKGTSLSYSNAIRQTKKSKNWENVTLSQIADFIAKKSAMAFMYMSSEDPKYEHTEQYCQSDIEFLSQLCHNAGCSLKVSNNIIIIFDQAEFEQNPEIMTIKFGEEYEKYSLSTNESDTYTSCRVYCTRSDGSVISATAYIEGYKESDNNNQCLQVCRNVSDKSQALELAKQMLRLHNKYEYEASFTFPGNTDLTAGSVVILEDFGAWNGKYIIRQAKHTLSSSGYSTQISLRKAIPIAPANEGSQNTEADYDVDDLALQVIRGDWDNGQARYDKLTAAGYDYNKIQNRVNEILGYR